MCIRDSSTLLGFSFYRNGKEWSIRIAPKSLNKIKRKMKEQTQRRKPENAKEKIKKIEAIIRGWVNYFSIARARSHMQKLDETVRTRLRMNIWKQWKQPRTRIKHLIELGINQQRAYEWGYSRKGYCRVAHSPILLRSLSNDYFSRLHYIGFTKHYFWKKEHQTKLF